MKALDLKIVLNIFPKKTNLFLFMSLLPRVLSGLAVAADPNFKTFQAAYPFVVRKLLTENTAATRKILHSVGKFSRKKHLHLKSYNVLPHSALSYIMYLILMMNNYGSESNFSDVTFWV